MSASRRTPSESDLHFDQVVSVSRPRDLAAPHSARARSLKVLVLGHLVSDPPIIPGVTFTHRPSESFDICAVVAPVGEEFLLRSIAGAGRSLCPVLDLSGSNLSRADFAATNFSVANLEEGFAAVAPIFDRLAAVPDFSGSPDSDSFLALGLSYSRARPIQVAWRPDRKQAVDYPLMAGFPDARALLEHLADEQLFLREFFHRAHVCDRCGSSRLNVEEQCSGCGSGQLSQTNVVHHYHCGNQAPQASFVVGDKLICPKCRKELRHFGVDYDKPGTVVCCDACGKVMDEPNVTFVCMDCCHATPGDGIETLDWFHYHLTDEGKLALETLQLPHVHFAKILDGHEQALSKRDFLLLSTHLLQTAERYGRDFTLCRIDAENLDVQRQSLGRRGAHVLFSKLVDLIRETLRETDMLTSNGDTILIAAPETSAMAADAMLRRLEDTVRKTLSPAPDLAHEVTQGENARAILDTLA